MEVLVSNKENCCGCTACYAVCPKGAITMKTDNEGFLYPEVNIDKCISCGKCFSVCPERHPYLNEKAEHISQYAVQAINDNIRLTSTAGGFFSVVAEYVIDIGGSVFAVCNDDLIVQHKKVENKSLLEKYRGSKYVQSHMSDVIHDVLRELKSSPLVLFVGTPCQVHAVKKMCKGYKNLLTIDLLCLGVSSPEFYHSWLNSLNKKMASEGGSIEAVIFRDKSYGYSTSNIAVVLDNGKRIEQKYCVKSFLRTFFEGYNMRPSCYECKFRGMKRAGDFTVGDFHTIRNYSDKMNDDQGTTSLWINTELGYEIFDTIKYKLTTLLITENYIEFEHQEKKLTSIPEKRADFWDCFNQEGYDSTIKKFVPKTIRSETANLVKPIINRLPFKKKIFDMIKRVKEKKFEKRVKSANSNIKEN